MLFKRVSRLGQWESPYGFAWREYHRDSVVVAVVPFNIIAGLLYRAWLFCAIGLRGDTWLDEVYNAGYNAGYTVGHEPYDKGYNMGLYIGQWRAEQAAAKAKLETNKESA